MTNVVNMVPCSMCEKEQIPLGYEEVCKSCAPKYEISLAIQGVWTAIEVLEKNADSLDNEAKTHLSACAQTLNKMTQEL